MTKFAMVTEKQLPVLRELVRRRGEWLRVAELPGRSSLVSNYLMHMVNKGLVEKKLRFGSVAWVRGSYLYRATAAGIDALSTKTEDQQ